MAQALLREGHQVTMVCGSYAQGTTGLTREFERGSRRGPVDGCDVIEFDLSYGNELGYLKRSAVFAKFALGSMGIALREPADIVFATSTPLTAGLPGVAARLLARRPFVFEVRDLWPELPRAMGLVRNPVLLWLMSALEWACYRTADRLIGLSPGIIEGIERRGVERGRIALVPNGCDLDLFSSSGAAQRPAGVRDDQLLAVFCGTHGLANGLDAILDAAAVLAARGRDDIRMLLVGQGREKPALVERARRERLDNIIFLDPVSKTRLGELLAGADLGLQCLLNVPAFYYGTSPNKFFDYIAAGLPVLNNYPGWLAEVIEENDCGFAVRPDDAEAFADVLIEASEDRQALAQKGLRARQLAETKFSRAKLAREWVGWVTDAGR